MNKLYKILFINSLIVSSLITVTSYSWLLMWMGVEINLLSIIPIMVTKNNLYSSESGMKYFLVQSLASTLLIFSILMLEKNIFSNMIFSVTQFSLLMKLGMAPFHWWLPEVMEGLTWFNCLIMLTWQKIAPMIMIMMTLKNSMIMNLVVIFSSLISGIQGLNQVSMKKIMAYSSINHMAWMLMSMMSSSWAWLIYFIIYSISNLILIMFFFNMKIYFINQINSVNNNKMNKTLLLMNFLSLSGIPPMIGFLPKWITIHFMIKNFSMILTFILIMSSIMHIYFYIRIIMPSLMMKIKETKIKTLSNYKNYLTMTFNIMFLMSLPMMNCLF